MIKNTAARYSYIILVLLISITQIYAEDATSLSILIPRGFTTDTVLELALSNYRLFHNDYIDRSYKKPKHWCAYTMQNTYFYQESTNTCDLARYFFPNNDITVTINQNGTGDIGSPWIDLIGRDGGNYSASMNILPVSKVWGGISKVTHDLSTLVDGLWLQTVIGVIFMQHNIDVFDRVCGAQGETPCLNRPIEAFNNNQWHYGKLNVQEMEHSGVDDILFRCGWMFAKGRQGHASVYGLALIPMGNRPQGTFLFEPIIGNGGHWGLGFGINLDMRLFSWAKNEVSVMLDCSYRYLFSARERRSFDLCNGDWTRYFKVASMHDPSTPCFGINFFTQDMDVTPRGNFDGWFAIHYRKSDFNIEGGLSYWWRNSEHVCLSCPFPEDIGIFDLTNHETSASTACISQTDAGVNAVVPDAVFTPITMQDINLDSARQRSVSTVKIYLAASINGKFLGLPSMTGFGVSYEMPSGNNALRQWAVWGKTNVSF